MYFRKFLFLIKVEVSFFDLESMGLYIPPSCSLLKISSSLIIFQISLFKSSLLFSYLLGGFPWGRVRGFSYLGGFLGGEVFVRLINQPVHS